METFSMNGTAAAPNSPDTSRPAVAPGVNAPSQLSSAVRVEGEITGRQDFFVDGEVNGRVLVPDHQISIGPNANVKADIKAKNVVLVGNVEGNIEATERVELRGTARLLGGLRSPRILIEHGAFIKGTVEVVR